VKNDNGEPVCFAMVDIPMLLAQMTAAGFLRASWSERVPFLSDFDDLAAFLEGVEQHG